MNISNYHENSEEIAPLSSDALISEEEKNFYQPDDYYQIRAFSNTPFEFQVITFEERKESSFPSKRGLYVAEILLLQYCSYGTYPRPRNGYPGFWWYEYGIRDVGRALQSLEKRGFIVREPLSVSVSRLTIPQLKELLARFGLSATGKKAVLVSNALENISAEHLAAAVSTWKYRLTKMGQQELKENQYVPFMHKASHTTSANSEYGKSFNVWCINRRIGGGDTSNWEKIVQEAEMVYYGSNPSEDVDTSPTDMATLRCRQSVQRSLASLKDAGFTEYRFLSTLDACTCSQCGALDGKVFKVSDAKEGINLPPMHKGCRCVICADDSQESLAKIDRAARDPATGKTVYVRGDMTYQEWYDKYVIG